jgi:hypothetical protein
LDEGMIKGSVGLFQPKKHTPLKQKIQNMENKYGTTKNQLSKNVDAT